MRVRIGFFQFLFLLLFWSLLMNHEWASLVAQLVKNLPAMPETWFRSLTWKDTLEKGMTTHSSVLAWRIPWKEEPGKLQSLRLQRLRHNWVTNTQTILHLQHVPTLLSSWKQIQLLVLKYTSQMTIKMRKETYRKANYFQMFKLERLSYNKIKIPSPHPNL